MIRLNDLIMAIISAFSLLVVNNYVPLPGLINLLFNCLMIVITIIYVMQFLNLVKPILPSPNIFK
jgi:hypothetical protein